MFFRLRRHGSRRGNPCVADHNDAGTPETALRQTQQLEDWRRLAQRVKRTRNAWLAAEGGDRGVRYRAFVVALADEERAAAEVERMIEDRDAGECVATLRTVPRDSERSTS